MKAANTPHDLFFDQLRDLHSMESQLSDSMPCLAEFATNGSLRDAIVDHSDETGRQPGLLIEIFNSHQVEVGDDKCKAIEALIDGGNAHLEAVEHHETRDLMLIAHCLRILHYEIAAYEITTRLATQLQMETEAGTLSKLLGRHRYMASLLFDMEPDIFHTATKKK